MHLSIGVSSVYLAIWLSGKGISADAIGVITAVPVLALMALNLYIGRLADRASDWRSVIIVLSLLAGLAPFGLFVVDEFWGILLVWTASTVTGGAIMPLVDAATMRMTRRRGTDFGVIRAWGTVGFVAATALTGAVVAAFGPDSFVVLFVVMAGLRALAGLQLPRFRAGPGEAASAPPMVGASALRDVMKPWFMLTVIGFALINATNALMGAFAGLVWYAEGISEATIGALIAVAAGAEALMMFAWRRLGWRVTARHMILIAGLAVLVRWGLMALNPPVAMLFALQCLHALTYAMGYFGIVLFVANWTSEEIAAEAQSFAFVVQQATTVVALLGFGVLFEAFGTGAFFAAAGFGALAVACVLASLRIQPAR